MYSVLVKMFAKVVFFFVAVTIEIEATFHCTICNNLLYILVQDIPEPLSRPDDSEYQEFRNFLAVTETGTQEKEEEQVCFSGSTLAL